ncbi:MAG: DUF2075 domain-containing protein [Aestuariivita sp.]|nr:DUF2075 domain-containing protein [Aestuariivita sp.]
MINRAGLEKFLRQSEGKMPPVFKGREDVLTTLHQAGENMRQIVDIPGHTEPQMKLEGTEKTTQIIQGAPGAGKSSVLAKLQKECMAREQEGAPRVVIVSSQSVVGSLPQVLKLIRAAGELSSLKWKDVLSRIGVNLSANSLGAISASVSWNINDFDTPTTLDQLAERSPSQNWKAPVIVAVDEAQRISGADNTAHARFLQSIHDASSGLPLTLVLAGLSDTKNTANQLGITRGITPHTIHCLDQADCMELVTDFCHKFGVDSAGYEPELYALAEPTEGWPRHIHFTFKALATELLRTDGNMATVNWKQVHDLSAQGRLSYYHHQQSDTFQAVKPLIGAVMHDLKKGDSFKLITNRIRRYMTDEMVEDLPDYIRETSGLPRTFLSHMIHQGALHEYEFDQFFSPIPSFRRHLIKEGIMDPTNPYPLHRTFYLYYGTEPFFSKKGFASYASARDWACKSLERMNNEKDISLWYDDIPIEILRVAATKLSSEEDNHDYTVGV